GDYMAAKKAKLNDQFLEKQTIIGGQTSDIFKGVVIHINGYTKPSSDELKKMMMLHGGHCEHYLSKRRVTHIVATNLPNSKIMTHLKHCKVVRPDWITDSVKAGKKLPYVPYLLFTKETRNQQYLDANSATSSIQLSKNVHDTFIPSTNKTISRLDHSPCKFQNNSNIRGDNSSLNATLTNRTNKSYAAGKAGDPDYLSEFYNHSRLHHLSTWKTQWKDYVSKLQSQDADFRGREKLAKLVYDKNVGGQISAERLSMSQDIKRTIMHIDMDCFFVSVGLRKRPDLKGKPIAVTHSKGNGRAATVPGSDVELERMLWRGGKSSPRKSPHGQVGGAASRDTTKEGGASSNRVKSLLTSPAKAPETYNSMAEIASCSYEARQAGVKNGMFLGPAKKLCPDLITIPYDFEGYQEVSKCLYDTVASYTHEIEAVSCDEMLVDCTDLLTSTGAEPLEFASMLREEIFEKTRCTVSIGMGSNILIGKLANRKAKPNGQYCVKGEDVLEFMKSQNVRNLPGVGRSTTEKLKSLRIETCEELQKAPLSLLQKEFGPKTGLTLYKYCRGEDDRPVKLEQERKSVSAEINYGIRFKQDVDVDNFLMELSTEVQKRLQDIKMKGKTITLKVMVRHEDAPIETSKFLGHGICNNFSKSTTLLTATDNADVIHRECVTILRSWKLVASDLRGIGIQVQRLQSIADSGKSNQSTLNFTVSKPVGSSKEQKGNRTNGASSMSIERGTGHANVLDTITDNEDLPVGNSTREGSECHQPPLPTLDVIDFTDPGFQVTVTERDFPRHYIADQRKESSRQVQQTVEINDVVSVTNDVPCKMQARSTISLCGATSIREIRALLNEWLQQQPEMEDNEVMVTYLNQLISNQNLEQMAVVVRFLNRKRKQLRDTLWQNSLDHIISEVQTSLRSCYGGPFKLN
ncbi:hypothetical protein FSP39_017616, partial [Pinctada imbricata]